MIAFSMSVDGASLELRIKSMGLIIRGRVRDAVTRAAIMLTAYVKEQKLSGQVLKNRSGTLRRKINYKVTEQENQISAAVGVKLAYAAAHEFGFDGMVSVRDYVRHVNSRNVRGSVNGKSGKTADGIAFVHAHERHMHLPERSYLRSSLSENAVTIRHMLAAAAGVDR